MGKRAEYNQCFHQVFGSTVKALAAIAGITALLSITKTSSIETNFPDFMLLPSIHTQRPVFINFDII